MSVRAGSLRYFVSIKNGSTPASGEPAYWEGDVAWATPDDLGQLNGSYIHDTRRKVTQLAVAETNLNVVPSGTVLMSTRAPIGHMAIAATPMAFNQGCRGLIPRDGTWGPYLLYVLKSRVPELNATANGTTFVELSRDDLASVGISLPSLEIQQRVATYLDGKTAEIDALIAKKQALLQRLSEKRQAIITQAVTTGLDPTAPLKDSGFDWLGRIPEHWQIKRLKYVSPRITVGIVITPAAYYSDEGVLAIRGLNVREMSFDLSDVRNISAEGHEINRKSELREGDLVAVRTGAPGTTAIVTKEFAGCNCIDLVIVRRPIDHEPRFVGWFLNSSAAKTQYEMGSEGALQQHFNIETAGDVVLSLPPKEEQSEIVRFIDQSMVVHERQESLVKQSIESLSEYRSALITAAVTGQIDGLK